MDMEHEKPGDPKAMCQGIHQHFGVDYGMSPLVDEPRHYDEKYWAMHNSVHSLMLALASFRLCKLQEQRIMMR